MTMTSMLTQIIIIMFFFPHNQAALVQNIAFRPITAAFTPTFGDVADLVFKVRCSTAPGHVLQVEALV